MLKSMKQSERAALLFALVYIVGFSVLFISRGNFEFVVYILTMLGILALLAANLRRIELPAGLLWGLTIWGLLHMAGGGVQIGDHVLYAHVLIPIVEVGPTIILKYDQVVHAYGYGVTAWLLWHILNRHHPSLRGSRSLLVYPALASMGLGAANEIVEFSAVVMFESTGVGGYYNTALDLVFNALGAVIAMVIIGFAKSGPSD